MRGCLRRRPGSGGVRAGSCWTPWRNWSGRKRRIWCSWPGTFLMENGCILRRWSGCAPPWGPWPARCSLPRETTTPTPPTAPMPQKTGRRTSTSSARWRWRRWSCRSWAVWSTAAPLPGRSGRTRRSRALPFRRTESAISCASTATWGCRTAPTVLSPGSRLGAAALPTWPWAIFTSTVV